MNPNNKPREDVPHVAGVIDCLCGKCPVSCDACAGSGKIAGGDCVLCNGTGLLKDEAAL